MRIRAAMHEVRCSECRVTWRSWAQRLLGRRAGFTPRPAYESCPECGVRWGYHRGVSCVEAEQRERAIDHAS